MPIDCNKVARCSTDSLRFHSPFAQVHSIHLIQPRQIPARPGGTPPITGIGYHIGDKDIGPIFVILDPAPLKLQNPLGRPSAVPEAVLVTGAVIEAANLIVEVVGFVTFMPLRSEVVVNLLDFLAYVDLIATFEIAQGA